MCQCLQARGARDASAIDGLLADQPADVRELVATMLGTLDRVGLGGDATPTPTDARTTPFGLLLQRLGAGTLGVVYPNGAFLFAGSVRNSAVGAPEFALPIPGSAGLVGTRLFTQFAWFGPASPPPCPPLGISASNALDITIQP